MANQANKRTWKSIALDCFEKVADVNLNPVSAIKERVVDKKTKPLAASLQSLKDRQAVINEESARIKMLQKVAKKTEVYKEELKAFSKDLKELGASQELQDFISGIGEEIVTRVSAEF